jgi:hypothetical protein
VQAWERAWERFIPFLAFPPELRKIIYTANAMVIWSRMVGQVGDLGCCVEDSVLDTAA